MKCATRQLPLALVLVVAACARNVPDSVRFADPVRTVEAIFEAARSGNTSVLPGLCRPDGGGDGDVREICEMTPGHEDWDEFVDWFSTGRVTADAMVQEDRARVPFRFGPDGSHREEMNLVRIGGRWYLSSY